MGIENLSVDEQEIKNFSQDSSKWWDEEGPFKPLHRLNPVRIEYIKKHICKHYKIEADKPKPLSKLKVIDIGCGGGIVCEPLSRLGASMNGLDADSNAIKVARKHAKNMGLKINYIEGAVENITQEQSNIYDVVLALEIVEHVKNPEAFVKDVVKLCKPGGLIVFSTLNRTPKSYALGIFAAENILKWVPRGTHQWKKFIRPSELSKWLRSANAQAIDIKGLVFSPLENEFKTSEKDIDVNYLITSIKEE